LPDEKKRQAAEVIANNSGYSGHLDSALVSDAIGFLVAQAAASKMKTAATRLIRSCRPPNSP
jgi:hypothetical protein